MNDLPDIYTINASTCYDINATSPYILTPKPTEYPTTSPSRTPSNYPSKSPTSKPTVSPTITVIETTLTSSTPTSLDKNKGNQEKLLSESGALLSVEWTSVLLVSLNQ